MLQLHSQKSSCDKAERPICFQIATTPLSCYIGCQKSRQGFSYYVTALWCLFTQQVGTYEFHIWMPFKNLGSRNSCAIAIWILYTKKSHFQMFPVFGWKVFRLWLYSLSTSPRLYFIRVGSLVLCSCSFPFSFSKKIKPIFSSFLQ